MSDISPFMRRAEIEKIHPVTDRARARAEEVGLFPKRVWLAPKIAGWQTPEVKEWLNDPAAWALRHRSGSTAQDKVSA